MYNARVYRPAWQEGAERCDLQLIQPTRSLFRWIFLSSIRSPLSFRHARHTLQQPRYAITTGRHRLATSLAGRVRPAELSAMPAIAMPASFNRRQSQKMYAKSDVLQAPSKRYNARFRFISSRSFHLRCSPIVCTPCPGAAQQCVKGKWQVKAPATRPGVRRHASLIRRIIHDTPVRSPTPRFNSKITEGKRCTYRPTDTLNIEHHRHVIKITIYATRCHIYHCLSFLVLNSKNDI